MTDPTIAILIKDDANSAYEIKHHYLNTLEEYGIDSTAITVLPLLYNTPSKVAAKVAKAYLDKLLPNIPSSVTKLIIADSSYFKTITKIQKVSKAYGATVSGAYLGYDKFECVFVPNWKSLFKQPDNINLIQAGLKTAAGKSSVPIIHYAEYGTTYGSEREILDSLYQYDELATDIETTGLSLDDTITSIGFAWNKHEGVAIDVSIVGPHYIRKFFEKYTGTLIFHGGLFDIKLMVRNWWMEHNQDYQGMLEGLHYFRNAQDTMLLAYLAKNSTTQVSLSLKDTALEYVGNYAIEIQDPSKYTQAERLEYNLIDCLGTMYLWHEKYPDQIETEPYQTIFQPSIYPLVKMMLTGLPINLDRAQEVYDTLGAKAQVAAERIQLNRYVQEFNELLREAACQKANEKLKTKVKTIDEFEDVVFNPQSNIQLAKLLFEKLGLPILERTKTKAPATGASVLEDLKNHTQDPDIIEILEQVVLLSDVTKIRNTFIKPFINSGGQLHGNLRLGGTQSGRLSSDDPNLTNLPSHGPMGKLVKSCVQAPEGFLFAGADFHSLEERIGAVLSKDPNRIKVYTDGYDGHSLRAYTYFTQHMLDITEALEKAETATKFWINEDGEYCCA